MQSLPPEDKSAQLLNSKPGPMTEDEKHRCIEGLETLNMVGYLKTLDPLTMYHHSCTPAQALKCMMNGESLFYGEKRDSPLTSIGGLEELTALAEKAQYRIVG